MRTRDCHSSNRRTGIHSLSSLTVFPDVRGVSLTVEAHVLFETRVASEKLRPLTFQQIVFSCRKTARVTRSQLQISMGTFLLSSEFLHLDKSSRQHMPLAILHMDATTSLQNDCGIQEKLSEHLSGSEIATCGAVLRGNHRRREARLPKSFLRSPTKDLLACLRIVAMCAQQRKRKEPMLLHCFCQTRSIGTTDFNKSHRSAVAASSTV